MAHLNRDEGVSILLVTHDPFSASYASRILFIKVMVRSVLNWFTVTRVKKLSIEEILETLGTFQKWRQQEC